MTFVTVDNVSPQCGLTGEWLGQVPSVRSCQLRCLSWCNWGMRVSVPFPIRMGPFAPFLLDQHPLVRGRRAATWPPGVGGLGPHSFPRESGEAKIPPRGRVRRSSLPGVGRGGACFPRGRTMRSSFRGVSFAADPPIGPLVFPALGVPPSLIFFYAADPD